MTGGDCCDLVLYLTLCTNLKAFVMKISEHIKNSIDACDSSELEKAMLFACLAVDGSAKKLYPDIQSVGKRFRRFIVEHIDIIELMFGGINLEETVFPLHDKNGVIGLKFEDVVYEKYRCNLAHGNELPDGYGIEYQVALDVQVFGVDYVRKTITLPESAIYALGVACVLSTVNENQLIGVDSYYYYHSSNQFLIDEWWGKIDFARESLNLSSRLRIKMDFS